MSVNKSLRYFMLSLISMAPVFAFACATPDWFFLSFRKRNQRTPLEDGTAEDFLDRQYGQNAWQYDDGFLMRAPEISENGSVIPVEVGLKADISSDGVSELKIYVEDQLDVMYLKTKGENFLEDSEIKFNTFLSLKNDHISQNHAPPKRQFEKYVFQVAKFKFLSGAIPYAALRFNLSPSSHVRIFAVYTEAASKKVRVVRPANTKIPSCHSFTYLKDDI